MRARGGSVAERAAGGVRAGEADGGDGGMLDHRNADGGAAAVHEGKQAGG